MSRPDSESSSRVRPRANTTSFPSFTWRRNRHEQPVIPAPSPQVSTPTLSVNELIAALNPPSQPSLSYARALANALPNYSPIPRREDLNPVLLSLCDSSKPTSIQAAGFDILSGYCENPEALSLDTAERVSYFSLFLGGAESWVLDLWEPRFKALRALTRYGEDTTGIESILINTLQRWIEGAFDGLAIPSERTERERSLEILVKFLEGILAQEQTISRISDQKRALILHFYASLVDRSITLPEVPREPLSTSPSVGHRRNISSLSSSSLPSLSSPSIPIKPPSEYATEFYLCHITAHIKILSPVHLTDILPLLFRALASCASPLPRLSVTTQPKKKITLEDRITEILNSIFAGPYSARCMLVLKQHLFPQKEPSQIAIMSSLGAHRTLRNYVRRSLYARLARAYISRETSIGYSHSGAPGHMELQIELMERAWPADDFGSVSGNGWDAGRMGHALADSVGAWIGHQFRDTPEERHAVWEKEREGKDEILEEAAGVLKDILTELDLRDDDGGAMDEEEAEAVGLTLLKLSGYVLPLKNHDGTPFVIPIDHPNDAPTPILRTISSLLARDHSRALNPLLSHILIHVAEHLTDLDTSRLPGLMMNQHDLSPTSPDWLDNWQSLLSNETLVSPLRPLTRRAIMDELQTVYGGVKDMIAYRRPLGDLVWNFCGGLIHCPGDQSDDADVIWKMIGEEIVEWSVEKDEGDEEAATQISAYLDLLVSVAMADALMDGEGESTVDEASIHTADTHSPAILSPGHSTVVSPSMSRMQTDSNFTISPQRESGLPAVMSMLTSFATGGGSSSRSTSSQPPPQEEVKEAPTLSLRDESNLVPRDVSAVAALVEVFSQLTFTPFSLDSKNLTLAIRVYDILLDILARGGSPRSRLTALQFLMRLRADRDHRIYFVSDAYDPNGLSSSLASLINRSGETEQPKTTTERERPREDLIPDILDVRTARTRFPHERNGRLSSRGRGVGGPSRSGASRSRSRTMAPPPPPLPKPAEPLWHIPETLHFYVSGPDSPSEVLVSYDPDGPDRILVLPMSRYLDVINDILEKETSWDILSYILCHLPVQLSNKHLFCGASSRVAVSKTLSILCTGVLHGDLASAIEIWPPGLKARDAHGLAYQTLSVLISYQRCFDLQMRHVLVEVLQMGLNGQLSTIKCCLHALSLSAFELQASMTKCLSRILEKLSQIMSNPSMAVHILGFLAIIGSIPSLHANFTEWDYKMVFGVALQFLQHYNQQRESPTISWALTQHVRILCYSVVYTWFLAVKLPDRPRHIQYIARQLLLANEGNVVVDGPTEVCFDWLARYTYASADPRPATSTFSDIVLNPSDTPSGDQKSWLLGNSVVTIRALARSGWVEVMSRRPSGFSRFVCHIENVPMVGPGEVDPDLLSIPAALLMERDPSKVVVDLDNGSPGSITVVHELSQVSLPEDKPPKPDPITGYVWSGTAPSQRRKEVTIDPSFLMLQLSPFPDGATEPFARRVPEASLNNLQRFVASLDRIPVIDTHKVGIMYVAPGQTNETDILRNVHGSPAYTRFLEGMGRLINLRGQVDVYAGGLDPDEDGEYAYAWWDDIGQLLYHTATMMPTSPHDPQCNNKKRHIGNDYVRIVWNDSGMPYHFETLTTQFQFVNIVIEPHSLGSIAAFSNNLHENEYFKVTIQLAPGMTEFAPIGHFKLISAENLPLLVRQLSMLADWFASVFSNTQRDTARVEVKTNWHSRLEAIRRFKSQLPQEDAPPDLGEGVMGQEALRDFTTLF